MRVFVYGTLTEPERVGRVLDSYVFVGPAALDGMHAVQGRYPTLAPGGSVGGRLLRTDDVGALDDYEGVDSGLYVRASVPFRGDGPETVEVYVGDLSALDVAEAVRWPGDDDANLARRVADYVEANDVAVRPTGSGGAADRTGPSR